MNSGVAGILHDKGSIVVKLHHRSLCPTLTVMGKKDNSLKVVFKGVGFLYVCVFEGVSGHVCVNFLKL